MNMTEDNILSSLGFNSKWVEIGILTPEVTAELLSEYNKGEDPYPEHYRWRAFQKFVQTNEELPPDVLRSLYILGLNDPDKGMGESIMFAIIEKTDCPRDLLIEASNSDRKSISKLATKLLNKTIG